MKNKYFFATLIILLATSCTKNQTYTAYMHQVDIFFSDDNDFVLPLNTYVTLTNYDKKQLDQVKDEFDNIIMTYHKEADSHHYFNNVNNVKVINDSYGTNNEVKISPFLYDLINEGIKLTKLTKGSFNIAMGSLIDIYDGKFDEPNKYAKEDIDKDLISNALTCIPTYEQIDSIIELNKENSSIKLNELEGAKGNVKISLGAISKGYIIQEAYNYLNKQKFSGFVNAGGSTLATINKKPDNSNWIIGLSTPSILKKDDSNLCALSLKESNFISTSAINQQNYLLKDENDKTIIRHHILDSQTGYSNNYYSSITVLSNNASLWLLDSLSTALFNVKEYDAAIELIKSINNEYNVNIDYIIVRPYDENSIDSYKINYNKNIKNIISETFSSFVKNVVED